MQLTPVESSHIAAIGYLEDERVLLVRYRDGALYAMLGWTPVAYEQLYSAPSKGQMLKRFAGPRVLISKEVVPTDTVTRLATAGASDTAPATPLNSLDEDAGKCCAKHLRSRVHPEAEERMDCPTCGLSFRREQVGPVFHWRITPVFLIRKR